MIKRFEVSWNEKGQFDVVCTRDEFVFTKSVGLMSFAGMIISNLFKLFEEEFLCELKKREALKDVVEEEEGLVQKDLF